MTYQSWLACMSRPRCSCNAPLASLSREHSADVMAALNAALIWLGVLLLIPPRTARHCLVAGALGALLLVSAPAEITIQLGQLSGWGFAGLALLVALARKNASASWLGAVGVTLVGLKPQSAIPLFIALGVLGYWQVLARAAAILAVTSLPGMVLFVHSAGSLSTILRTIRDNLDLVSRLPPCNLANPGNLRVDGLGVLSHLHAPALLGVGWLLLAFSISTGLLVVALNAVRARRTATLADPCVAAIVSLYIVVSLYHLTYDHLLLYIGPLAAFGLLTDNVALTRSSRAVAAGGVALMTAGFAFRSGFCARMVNLGVSALSVHEASVIFPTLIGAAIIRCALALDRTHSPLAAT
jgi:Glycosyltransferase family 87